MAGALPIATIHKSGLLSYRNAIFASEKLTNKHVEITPTPYSKNIFLIGNYRVGKTTFALVVLNTYDSRFNIISKITDSFPNVYTKDFKTFILNGDTEDTMNMNFDIVNLLSGGASYKIVDGLIDTSEYETLPFL